MNDIEYLQKLKSSQILQDIEWKKCKDDPYYFMTNWAFTLDAHDMENPIKPFPKKAYIEKLVELWLSTQLLFVPKSRQMMVSWIFTVLYLWDAQFHVGRLNVFRSQKADDADKLIERVKFVYDHEPSFLKRYMDNGVLKPLRCNPQNGGKHTQGKLTFPDVNSKILGIASGADTIRSITASGVLADEMAFQSEAGESFTAIKPTLGKVGKFTGVSTAEDDTYFLDAVYDNLKM